MTQSSIATEMRLCYIPSSGVVARLSEGVVSAVPRTDTFKINASKPNTGQKRLFNPPHKDFELPGFEYNELIEAFDQMELLGSPLISQFSFLKHPLDQSILARSLKKYVGEKIVI